jgi:mannose-6-phosphate isomerase-like protein (cupin superfamily)
MSDAPVSALDRCLGILQFQQNERRRSKDSERRETLPESRPRGDQAGDDTLRATREGAVLESVNLAAAFAQLSEPWSPRIVGELNGQHVKLAKATGSFVWHHHAEVDELFLVVQGALDMHLRDPNGAERVVPLEQGALLVVPRGVEHKPVAREGGANLLLFEPTGTRNTGNVVGHYTVEPEDLQHLKVDTR